MLPPTPETTGGRAFLLGSRHTAFAAAIAVAASALLLGFTIAWSTDYIQHQYFSRQCGTGHIGALEMLAGGIVPLGVAAVAAFRFAPSVCAARYAVLAGSSVWLSTVAVVFLANLLGRPA